MGRGYGRERYGLGRYGFSRCTDVVLFFGVRIRKRIAGLVIARSALN